MTQLDAIWKRAESDLAICTDNGDSDPFLWEHSARVGRNALRIAELPGVANLSPDPVVVVAAALYHDAAWALRVKSKEVSRFEVLVRSPSDDHREHSASYMRECLRDLVPAELLDRAADAVMGLDQRDLGIIEGQIVSDADNLDDFSATSLWSTIRRGALDGNAIQAVIDRWHRRTEYHFWSARLSDSFRFQVVRTLAKKRLAGLERLMHELEEQQAANDFPPS